MSSDTFLTLFTVVLVEPEDSLNIGAVARAMMNLGFSDLRLVAPIHFERERSQITARLAVPLLERATVYDTLAEALQDQEEVVGLSLRPGRSPAHFVTLPAWSAGLPGRPPRKTALVFGPENNGLRHEHLYQCRWIVYIPAQEAFPAFNLAQSVLLVLYEVTRTLTETSPSQSPLSVKPMPAWNEFQQMDRLLDTLMEESGFIGRGSPMPTGETIKTLLRRLEPTAQELGLLMALFARLSTTLQRRKGEERE